MIRPNTAINEEIGLKSPYPNAPIAEAILDIRISGTAATLEAVGRFAEAIKSSHPVANKIGEVTAQMRPDLGSGELPELAIESSTKQVGYSCVSENKKEIIQARVHGFTFSRLRPYDRWETFKAEARRLWVVYREQIRDLTVTRLAIRTVNKLNLPHESVDLKDWLRTSPEVSPVFPQGLSSFFMQIQQPHDDMKAVCIINEALAPPEMPKTVSVILDVDLFRIVDVPQADDEIWSLFDLMRERKDEIFESCITQKTRELFI